MTFDPAWQPIVDDPDGAALFLDFDGTLAPIVDDPATAAPSPGAVDALTRLGHRLACVAVVSGRPVEFLRRHLPDPAVTVVGQYGLEREVARRIVVDPRAAVFADAVAGAAIEAARRWPSVTVERKGRIAATVHWRSTPTAEPGADELAALAADWGLVCAPGRMACELRPALPVDKGTVVATLLAEHDPAFAAFAGDDLGDVKAFDSLARWAEGGPCRSALRVAVASDESPAELVGTADLVVDGPLALLGDVTAVAARLDS